MKLSLKSFIIQSIEEPYRLFFPFGVFMGLLGVGHWALTSVGIASHYLSFQHASTQIQLFMYCFVAGFLLTAMPKILLSHSCTHSEFVYFFSLLFAALFFELIQFWIGVQICFILGMIGLHVFILNRGEGRKAPLPAEFTHLFFGFANAILGALILLFYQIGWMPSWGMNLGRQMFQLGFLASVVMGIGGFMGPRLMGYYSWAVVKIDSDPEEKERLKKKELNFQMTVGFVVFLSFWLDAFGGSYAGSFIRAFFISAQILYSTKIYKPLMNLNIFTFLLRLSFWLFLAGFWGLAFFPAHHIAFKHVLFIGSFSLITFTVATKIIYTHSGFEAYFHQKMPLLYIVGGSLLGALAFRVLADYFPGEYVKFIFYSSTIWVVGVFIWLVNIAPKLFVVTDLSEFKKKCSRSSA